MGLLFHYLETGLVLVTMFTLLVAAHELGHYLFARMFNMGVEEFAIGFGRRPLFNWMRRTYEIPLLEGQVADLQHQSASGLNLESAGSRPPEDMVLIETPSGKTLKETTRFTVRPWPLGGFVRIKGMMPEEDGSEIHIAGGFYSKPPWQRLLVLFAGPMFSILAGIFILVPLYIVNGAETVDNRPIIGEISADGPAASAGLREGDIVKSIDGKTVATFYDVNVIVRDSADKKLLFNIEREGHPLLLTVVPKLDKTPSPLLGPGLKPTHEMKAQAKLFTHFVFKTEPVGVGQALSMAISYPIDGVMGLVDMVRHPATIKDSVGGPIAITAATYQTVKHGISPILGLAAMLSISVGILNLLPVMPLDGGQMALAFAEMFRRGKRLSMQVQSLVTMVGFAFMCVLIVCVFFVDINRFFDSGSQQAPPSAKKSK